MRRRLRKKLQRGEFELWLIPTVLHFRDDDFESAAFDAWFDAFVEALEAHGLSFGGGGRHPIWSGAIDAVAAGRTRCSPEDYNHVAAFLEKCEYVLGYRLGPITPTSEYCRLLDEGEFDEVFVEIPEDHRREIERCLEEIDRGEVESIPWEELRAELWAKLPKSRR